MKMPILPGKSFIQLKGIVRFCPKCMSSPDYTRKHNPARSEKNVALTNGRCAEKVEQFLRYTYKCNTQMYEQTGQVNNYRVSTVHMVHNKTDDLNFYMHHLVLPYTKTEHKMVHIKIGSGQNQDSIDTYKD